jgi:hypothetical protein
MLKKRITLWWGSIVILTLIVGVGWSPYHYRRNKYIPRPIIIGHCYSSFQERIADIVDRDGGLPKAEASLLQCRTFISQVSVYPCEKWKIEQVIIENLHRPLSVSDPTYQMTMDIHVQYQDGDVALLRWTTWNYGYHIGPVIISQGIGAPWEISRWR